MDVKQSVLVSLIHMMLAAVDGTPYERPDFNLTYIPVDIPMSATKLDLQKNLIAAVDYMPGIFPSLDRIELDRNLLTVFPELGNCTAVRVLSLNYNQLASIPADRLDALTKLVTLNMRGNRLAAIPDVSGPSASLETLNVRENIFTEIPLLEKLGKNIKSFNFARNRILVIDKKHLLAVRNTIVLTLTDNQLEFVPELQVLQHAKTIHLSVNPFLGNIGNGIFPSLNSLELMALSVIGADTVPWDICLRGDLSMGFEIRLKGNPLFCDERLRWLKLAEDAGVTVTDGECQEPALVAETEWEAIDWTQLRGGTVHVYIKCLDVVNTFPC